MRILRLHWKEKRGRRRALIQAKLYSGEGHAPDRLALRAAAGWDASLLDMPTRRVAAPRPLDLPAALRVRRRRRRAVGRDAPHPPLHAAGGQGVRRRRHAPFPRAPPSRPPVAPVAGASGPPGSLSRPRADRRCAVRPAPAVPLFRRGGVDGGADVDAGYDLRAGRARVLYHRYERNYRSTFWGAATLDDAAALKGVAGARALLAGEPLVPPPPADASSTPPPSSPPSCPSTRRCGSPPTPRSGGGAVRTPPSTRR